MAEFPISSHYLMVMVMLGISLVIFLSKLTSPWPEVIYACFTLLSVSMLLVGQFGAQLTLGKTLDEFHLFERYHRESPDNIYDRDEVLEFSSHVVYNLRSYLWWGLGMAVNAFLFGLKIGSANRE